MSLATRDISPGADRVAMPLKENDVGRVEVKFFVLGIAVALSACGSSASTDAKIADRKDGAIKVDAAWAQPVTAAGTSAAVYMSISANCTTPDVLQSVEAVAPQEASLHASSVVDNALAMTPVKSVPVPCEKSTVLKPMGTHVMVTNIKKPVGIGDQITLTLRFERAGAIPVQAEVTSMAVLENVDPMNMNKHHAPSGGMKMDHMNMH